MTLTCKELLDRVMNPEHSSQDYFGRHSRDGKMLDTCKQNGYSFAGGYGFGRGHTPDRVHLRAETALHEMVEELRHPRE